MSNIGEKMYNIEQFKTFTAEMFEGVHLTVLRELGREIGVKAPT